MQHNSAYVYIFRQISTGKWYIGSRTKQGCHPDDGYQTSSNTVKTLIKQHPQDWERQLIYVGDPSTAVHLERDVLIEFNAKKHPDSYNLHHNIGPFWNNKIKGKPRTPEHKAKIAAGNKGKFVSEETKQKMRLAKLGTKQTPEQIQKRADAMRGVLKPRKGKSI